MNGLNNFGKTKRGYLLAPTDHLVRLWRPVVKVTACRRHPRWQWCVEVHLISQATWPSSQPANIVKDSKEPKILF